MKSHVGHAKYVPGSYPAQTATAVEMVERQFREWNRRRRKASAESEGPPEPPLSICFSRKVGVGALEVADRVAPRIGYRVFDRELIEHVAADRDLSEKTASLFDERYPGKITEFMNFLVGEKSFVTSDYLRTLHRVVYSAAGLGPTLFVGRGAHLILPRDRVLAVRFIASPEYRVRRLTGLLGVDPEEAGKLIAEMDKEQRSYFKKAFDKKDASPYEFDLVINCDWVSDPAWAADIVVAAYRSRPSIRRAEAGREAVGATVPA